MLLLLTALAVVVLLLAADRSMIPGWLSSLAARHPAAVWAETLRGRLPDLLPLIALVLVVWSSCVTIREVSSSRATSRSLYRPKEFSVPPPCGRRG